MGTALSDVKGTAGSTEVKGTAGSTEVKRTTGFMLTLVFPSPNSVIEAEMDAGSGDSSCIATSAVSSITGMAVVTVLQLSLTLLRCPSPPASGVVSNNCDVSSTAGVGSDDSTASWVVHDISVISSVSMPVI